MRVLSVFDNICYVACKDQIVAFDRDEKEIHTYQFAENDGSSVITLTVTSNGKYVIAGYSNKYVCCWDRVSGTLLGSAVFKKRPSAIVCSEFAKGREAIIVSDKAGDIWGADAPLMKKQIILAGHTASVVTDLSLHGSLIVSADRDEKVRVSRFPDLETIISYCLGHKSVVSSVEFITVNGKVLLVSASWDHTLCLWNPETGLPLATFAYQNTATEANSGETASSSAAVAEEVQQEGAAEEATAEDSAAAAGAENLLDEEEEKTYDESSAGNFPFKVATSTTIGGTAIVAIIFKGLSVVKVHHVKHELNGSYEFTSECSTDLPAVPSDIVFSPNGQLVVLLPQPHCVQFYSVAFDVSTEEFAVSSASAESVGVGAFQNKCTELGVNFCQYADDNIGGDNEEERGMLKHNLDKPFDRTRNIDYSKKRGAKRSKKNKSDE